MSCHLSVIYVNGIRTSEESAKTQAEDIGKLMGMPVTLHYNEGTSDHVTVVKNIIFGELKKGFVEVKGRKRIVASLLKKDIKSFLKQDQYNRVLLIMHSQGSDVGLRAIGDFDEKSQHLFKIRRVVLGGNPIAVVNVRSDVFTRKGDRIPLIMREIRDRGILGDDVNRSHCEVEILPRNSICVGNHLLSNYLKDKTVAARLRLRKRELCDEIWEKAPLDIRNQIKELRGELRNIPPEEENKFSDIREIFRKAVQIEYDAKKISQEIEEGAITLRWEKKGASSKALKKVKNLIVEINTAWKTMHSVEQRAIRKQLNNINSSIRNLRNKEIWSRDPSEIQNELEIIRGRNIFRRVHFTTISRGTSARLDNPHIKQLKQEVDSLRNRVESRITTESRKREREEKPRIEAKKPQKKSSKYKPPLKRRKIV
jgi:hypothetical protein